MKTQLDDKYYLLRELEKTETNSQRALAQQMGISLGKINFILKALIGKGLVKMENFAHNEHKAVYRYVLTPAGIKERVRITKDFIRKKENEYENLKMEIEEAKQDIEHSN